MDHPERDDKQPDSETQKRAHRVENKSNKKEVGKDTQTLTFLGYDSILFIDSILETKRRELARLNAGIQRRLDKLEKEAKRSDETEKTNKN